MPRGSDGTMAHFEEMKVSESPAAVLMSSYLSSCELDRG